MISVLEDFNTVFTIVSAGVLTLEDIISGVMKLDKRPDAIFMSSIMLSSGGYDLAGNHYKETESIVGCPIIPMKGRTGSI